MPIRHVGLVALFAVLAHSPLLLFDIVQTSDGYIHKHTAQAYSLNFSWTVPYPRWLPENQNGFGSPFLFFYAPGVYFLYSCIDHLTLGALPSHATLALTLAAFSSILGLGTYLLLRRDAAPVIAILSSLVAIFAPYHLFIGTAIRGSLPEAAGLAFTPLILLAARRQIEVGPTDLRYFVVAALSYAATIYTHVLSAIMLVPLVGIFVLIQILQTPGRVIERARRLAMLGASFLTGTLLAAPLLLTSIFYMQHITPEWWWQNPNLGPQYATFLRSRFLGIANEDMKFADPIGVFWLLVLVALLVIAFFWTTRRTRLACTPFLGMAVLSLSFFTAFPSFLFAEGGLLHLVQFPMRFLHFFEYAVICAGAIVLSALVSDRRVLFRAVSLALVSASAAVLLLTWFQFYRLDALDLPRWRQDRIETLWQNNEYLPSAATAGKRILDVQSAIMRSERPLFETSDPVEHLEATPLGNGAASIEVESSRPFKLHVRQFAFPGWSLVDIYTRSAYTPTSDDTYGTLVFDMGPGHHNLVLSRTPTPVGRIGTVIASVAALVLLGAAFVGFRRTRSLR